MTTCTRSFSWGFVLFLLLGNVRADVRPPIKVTLALDNATPAVSGEEYAGTLLITSGMPGVLDHFSLKGDGWDFVDVGLPGSVVLKVGDVIPVNFTGIPRDAKKPFTVEVVIDGVGYRRSIDVSPQVFERAERHRHSFVDNSRPASPSELSDTDLSAEISAAGGQSIRFFGRIIYTRQDGAVLGADGVLIRLMDEDAISDEVMYEGVTNSDGRFDVTINWEDCDFSGCDVPDIYLYVETDTPVAVVQDDSIFEEDYSWQFAVMNDFGGNVIAFGNVEPPGNHQALHILSTLTKAHRFILQNDGTDVEQVDVIWPDFSQDAGAWYNTFFDEVHLTPSEEWNEGTIIHEYGHHYQNNHALHQTSDYCNGYCDNSSAACVPGTCAPLDPLDLGGHCQWCPETSHDAWNEGWPNWLGGAVMRTYMSTYNFMPQFFNDSRYNVEFVNTCCQDGSSADPFLTEGFVTALLQDIEDGNQDGVPPSCDVDALSLGVDEIFQVTRLDSAANPADFLTKWRTRFPQFDLDFWSTARNVTTQYSFPEPTLAIVSPPQSCASARVGQPLSITVTGNGSLLSFQWRRNGVNLMDDGRITGSSSSRSGSATLNFSPLQAADEAVYDVVVSNCPGTQQVTSAPIRVKVHPALGVGTAAVSWGRNLNGALGHGQFTPEVGLPNPVVNFTDFTQVANGKWHSLGLRSDGTVWAWGSNFVGQLGDDTIVSSPVPVQCGVVDAIAIAAGDFYSMAVRADGTLLTWGDNNFSTLGIPGPNRSTPTPVPNLNCVTAIAAGDLHAVAVNSDGTAWTWGYNAYGQLGHGHFGGIVGVPAPMVGITDAVAATAGNGHTIILRQNGTLLACGWNDWGQLGVGDNIWRNAAAPVVALSNVAAIDSHGLHSLAVRADGTAWAWGNGSSGQLGIGPFSASNVPAQVVGLTNVTRAGAAYLSSAFLRANGTVWVCGNNSVGGLGVSVAQVTNVPVPLSSIVGATGLFGGTEHLTVLAPPQPAAFLIQPGSRTYLAGQTATFTVTVSGTPQIAIQWLKNNGIALSNGNGVSGVDTAVLTISPLVISDAGTYSAMISNAYGSLTSTTATLTVSMFAGDFNADNQLGLLDFAALADCMAGPGAQPAPIGPGQAKESCLAIFDIEADSDVDLPNLAAFLNVIAP